MKRNKAATMAGLAAMLFAGASIHANATDRQQLGVSIAKLRMVEDYQGTTFDNTVELWPATPLTFASGSNCRENTRNIALKIRGTRADG